MPYSRRSFLQVGLTSLPAVRMKPVELSSIFFQEQKSPARPENRRYEKPVWVYAVPDSAQSATDMIGWIRTASDTEIESVIPQRDRLDALSLLLQEAKADLANKEKNLAYWKDSKIVSNPTTLQQEPKGEREKRVQDAEAQARSSEQKLKSLKTDYQTARANARYGSLETDIGDLVNAESSQLKPEANLHTVDLAVCGLFTSNGNEANPWRKSRGRTDQGMLSLTVNYIIPERPPCWKQMEGESTILYHFKTADGMTADIPYQLVFKDIPVSVAGGLELSIRLVDVADAGDQGFLGKVTGAFKKAWNLYQGLSIKTPFTAAASAELTRIVQEFEAEVVAREKNYVIWDQSKKENGAITFSNQSRVGTFALLPGSYVVADRDVRLSGYRLVNHKLTSPSGDDPLANYLVLSIGKSPSSGQNEKG